MKQHTCTHCQVTTTTEDITIQTDLGAIEKNVRERLIYEAACRSYEYKLLEHNNKISNYQRIVFCHNESKHFWQSDWIVHISHDRVYLYLDDGWECYEASSKYPPFDKPLAPRQIQVLTQYIECPVCKFKYYL